MGAQSSSSQSSSSEDAGSLINARRMAAISASTGQPYGEPISLARFASESE